MFVLPSIFILLAASLALPDANPALYIFDKFFASNKRLHKSFNGKRIWITGASSGIGAELSRQLHSHGAKIIMSGRREEELRRVQSICQTNDASDSSIIVNKSTNTLCDISILPFDVTDSDEKISTVVSTALNFYGGLDVLILNAGAGQLSPAIDDSFSTTRALMEINYMGPVRIAMEVIKQEKWNDKKMHSKKEKAHIVVTSSVASKMALPLGTSYAASKHAVHGYFSSLRSECAEWLRIDLPCPGPIATAFQSNVLNAEPSSSVEAAAEDEETSEVQMPVDRCASLIISGMMGPASLMQETWISRQPTLFFLSLNQYFPNLSNMLLGKIGPLRLKAFRAGLPLYKVSSWLQAAKMEQEQMGSSKAGHDLENEVDISSKKEL
jgi:dehydrogenase/reductase SDR family protein 7